MAARQKHRALKIIRRIIAVLGVLVLLILLTAASVGIWAYRNPHEAFEIVQRHFLPEDLKISWEAAHLDTDWLGGLDFKVDLSVDGLKISKGKPDIVVPLDHIRVQASVFPIQRRATIHLVEALATKTIEFHASPDATAAPEKNPFQQIQSVLAMMKLVHDRVPVEAVDLQAKSFVFYPAQGAPLEIAATIHQEVGTPLQVSAVLDLPSDRRDDSTLSISADGTIDFEKINSKETFLDVLVKFKGAGVTTEQKIAGIYTDETAQLTSTGPLKFAKKKLHLSFSPTLVAKFNPHEADLHLETDVKGIPGPLARVDKVILNLKTPLEPGESWSDKPSKFSVAAPIDLFFVDKARREKMESACACQLPETVMAEADGKIWLQTLLTEKAEKHTALEARLKIESVKNKIFTIDLAASLRIEKEQKTFSFFPQLNCTASVSSFKALHPILDAYGALIPAPLDVLDGTLVFKANGPVSTDESGSTFPLALEADLSSTSQNVKIATEASARLNTQFTAAHFDVKAKVIALNLDLPPLDPLGGLPRVAPDARFRKSPKAEKKVPPKFKLSFNFEIETEKDGAIRLSSKYFKPYLPLTLKIQSNGAKENSGFIQSEPFSVTYLRRTVRVEHLHIGLDSDDKGIFPMKGRLSVKQTDYTVFIDVEGTTKSPNVTMSSEPYLPQNDIIAVLLYDRVNDQLVSGDAETTGGVQGALADQAIGLFGIWAFAATPIKSFSYNPVTKVYRATVAVSDDLTAGIGTNWEESARLELRKRVSKRWSLTAAYIPATQDENATTKLVLQWEKRF